MKVRPSAFRLVSSLSLVLILFSYVPTSVSAGPTPGLANPAMDSAPLPGDAVASDGTALPAAALDLAVPLPFGWGERGVARPAVGPDLTVPASPVLSEVPGASSPATSFLPSGRGVAAEHSGAYSYAVGSYAYSYFLWGPLTSDPPAIDLRMEVGTVSDVGMSYVTVTLAQSYDEMVVIAIPQYDGNALPKLTRVRSAQGNSFQVKLQGAHSLWLSEDVTLPVHYLVIEAGSHLLPDGRAIEAQRVNSTVTDYKNSWQGQELDYLQSYTNPVVLGQVMSENDPDWSVFWGRGGAVSEPPDGDHLWVGKMVGEDSDVTRETEVLGVVVIEAGAGSLGEVAYRAAVGPDTVQGVDNSPPYAYSFSPAFGSAPEVALVSQAGMDGNDGGWAVLYGADPLSASGVDLVIDEDQIGDTERGHTHEQVAYLVFEEPLVYSCTVVADFAGSPLSGTAPLTVTFTNDSTGASSYLWDFGDGATSTSTDPTHVYTAAGVFTVTLQAGNGVVTETCQRPDYIRVIPALGDLRMEVGTVSDVGTSYVTVTLAQSYDEMVVIATPQYGTSSQPLVTRVRNAAGDSFQVKLQNPSGESLLPKTVHYLVIEAGRYTLPDGRALEARRMNSTLTDRKDSWQAQELGYWQSYTNPVVLGQVMSENDADWSVFWDRGVTSQDPPDSDELWVGKMVGQDSDTIRETELLGVVVIEAGAGSLEGVAYRAAVGPDTVQGIDDAPPYVYNFSPAFGSTPEVALVSQAGMDGNDGGWAALFGPEALSASSVDLVIDEDQIGDNERAHATEQVAYLVFEESLVSPPPVFADFGAAPRQGPAALTVQFTDTSELSVDAWRWDFGTGEITTTRHPIHTYQAAGLYTVTLRVTDTDTGRWDELVRPAYITVTPVASFTAAPLEGAAPLTVQFTDTSSQGVDAWHWDFGTGATSGEENPLYTYEAGGLFTVTLRVTDTDTGEWDAITRTEFILVTSMPGADFTKAVSPVGVVGLGDVLAYTLHYSNTGTEPLTGVVITDTLPTGVAFLSASGGVQPVGGVLTWSIGDLPVGGSGVLTFTVQVAECGATPANQAQLLSLQLPPLASNVVSNTVACAELLKQSAPAGVVTPESVVTFTLRYSNTGSQDLSAVVITDVVPSGVQVLTDTISDGGVFSDGNIVWEIGALDCGAGGSASFAVQLLSGTAVITNQAWLDAAEILPLASEPVVVGVGSASITIESSGQARNYPGDVLGYTIRYTNTGDAAIPNALILNPVPSGTLVITQSIVGNWELVDGVIRWSVGTLPSEASGTVGYDVEVERGDQPVVNQAWLHSSGWSAASNVVTDHIVYVSLSLVLDAPDIYAGALFGDLVVEIRDSSGLRVEDFQHKVWFDPLSPDLYMPGLSKYSDRFYYVFTTGGNKDNGYHVFENCRFNLAGAKSFKVTDGTKPDLWAALPIEVQETYLSVTVTPTETWAGVPTTLVVKAVDSDGQVVTGYRNRVIFTSRLPGRLPNETGFPGNDFTFTYKHSGVYTRTDFATYMAGTQVVTVTDWYNGNRFGSSNPLEVRETYLSVTVTPTETWAGVPTTLVVKAVDSDGQVVTGFRNKVIFTSRLPGKLPNETGSPGNDFTFTKQNKGVYTRTDFATYMAGTQVVTVTDCENGNRFGSSNPVEVRETYFSVTIAPTQTWAGVPITLTVKAVDSQGQVVTGYRNMVVFNSLLDAALPNQSAFHGNDYTFDDEDYGVHEFNGIHTHVSGTQIITVTDTGWGGRSSSSDPQLVHQTFFSMSIVPGATEAGTPLTLRLQAVTAEGGVLDRYRGRACFASSDPQAQLPYSYPQNCHQFDGDDAGTYVFPTLKLYTSGTQVVTATHEADPACWASASAFVGSVSLSATLHPTATLVGENVALVVRALDSGGELAEGYTAYLCFSSSDPYAELPRFCPLWDTCEYFGPGGVETYTIRFGSPAPTHTITIRDSHLGTISTTTPPIEVGGVHLSVTLAPSTTAATGLLTFTIRAVDEAGEVVPSFVGPLYFHSSDPWAQLPHFYLFENWQNWDMTPSDQGVLVFKDVALNTAGTHVITVTYDEGQIVGTSNPVTVTYPLHAGIQRHEENSPALGYGTAFWERDWVGGAGLHPFPSVASGGYVASSDTPGDSASLSFEGPWVGVGFVSAGVGGKAEIWVDGDLLDVVDTYSTTSPMLAFGRYYTVTGLPTATHVLEVRVAQETSSSGHVVRLDYVDTWDGSDLPGGRTAITDTERISWSEKWAQGGNRRAGGFNAWFAFDGDAVAYHAGPTGQGQVEVFLDGVSLGQAQLSPDSSTLFYSGFSRGPHILHVRRLGGTVPVEAFEDYGDYAGTIVGQVVDAEGTPLPDSQVLIAGESSLALPQVDAQGCFAASVISDVYVIRAEAPTYAPATSVISVPQGLTVTVRLTLTQAGTVQGQVVDGQGSSVEGVLVSVGGVIDYTNVSGEFELAPVPVGAHTLVATRPDYKQSTLPVEVSHDQTTVVQVTLDPECDPDWGDLYIGGYVGHPVVDIDRGVVARQMAPGDWEHAADLDVKVIGDDILNPPKSWPDFETGPLGYSWRSVHAITRMRYDPVNSVLYAYGSSGTLYRSRDGGFNWQVIEPPMKAVLSEHEAPVTWQRDGENLGPSASLEYVQSFDVDQSTGRIWIVTTSTSPFPLPFSVCLACLFNYKYICPEDGCGAQCYGGGKCSAATCFSGSETPSIYFSDNQGTCWTKAWNVRDAYGHDYPSGCDPENDPCPSGGGMTYSPRDWAMIYMQPQDISVSSTGDGRVYVVLDSLVTRPDPGSAVMVGTPPYELDDFEEIAVDYDFVQDNCCDPEMFGVHFNHVYPDPVQPGLAYIGTSIGLLKLASDGEVDAFSWVTGTLGLSIEGGDRLAIDPRDTRVMYYGVGAGSFPKGVIKTTDGGATWELKNAGMGWAGRVDTVVIAEDGTLYAGVNSSAMELPQEMIYRSDDGGDCWYDITGDMHEDARVPEPALFHKDWGPMKVLSIVPIGPQQGNLELGFPRWAGISGEMVNLGTGNLALPQPDLEVPGRGVSLEITRVYNSHDTYRGPFGYGWSYTYGIRLALSYCGDPRVVTVIHANGQRVPYIRESLSDPFEAPPGIYETLEQDGGTYILTFKDRTQYFFSGNDGRLLRIRDRNANVTELIYSGPHNDILLVTDAVSRSLIFTIDPATGLITSVTDPAGQTLTYEYDDNLDLVRVTDQMGGVTTYTYCLHRLESVTDPEGNTTTYEYDDRRRVVRITDAESCFSTYDYPSETMTVYTDKRGNTITYHFDDRHRPIQEEGPGERNVSYTYNGNSDRTSFTDSRRNTTTYEYDDRGNPTLITLPETAAGTASIAITYNDFNEPTWQRDAESNETTYEYDGRGNLLTVTNPLSGVNRMWYKGNGDLTSVRDPEGRVTGFTYDAYGNLASISRGGGTTRYQNDILGRRIRSKDALENVTLFHYDGLGRLVSVTNALSDTVFYVYDKVGNRRSQRDALNRVTYYDYDHVYNLIVETDPLDGVTLYGYDGNRNQTCMTDPRGMVTKYGYDAQNRLVSETVNHTTTTGLDPNTYNLTTLYAYDPDGNQTRVTDARGNPTDYAYDALNRTVAITDAKGGGSRYWYDLNGNLTLEVDPRGTFTWYAYDELNRLVMEKINWTVLPGMDPNTYNLTTSYGHDKVGNRTSITDAAGNSNLYEYDALNHVVAVTDALGNATRSEYDLNGNRVREVDRLGTVTRYEYDELHRLETEMANWNANPNLDPDTYNLTTRYEYDKVGNLIAVTDPLLHTTHYSFDALDRTEVVTDALGGVTRFQYDANGNLIFETDARDTVTRYEYDLVNRLVAVTANDIAGPNPDPNTYDLTTHSEYDAVGNRVRVIDPLGHATDYAYDALNRLEGITDALGRVTLYSYDAVGNLILETDARGTVTRYEYDRVSRLVTETANLTTTAGLDPDLYNVTTRYTYDKVGNTVYVVNAQGTVTRFGYDALSRVVTETANLVLPIWDPNSESLTTHFRYDKVGNVLAVTDVVDMVTEFEYDPLGRLLLETLNRSDDAGADPDTYNLRTHYQYDGLGNRLAITDAAGMVTRYEYDALSRLLVETANYSGDPGADPNVYNLTVGYQYDALGNRTVVTDPRDVTTAYGYDPLGRLVLITYTDGVTESLGYDKNSQVVREVDGNGNVRQTVYDPVGNVVRRVDPLLHPTEYGFDAVDNMVAITDARGLVTRYDYDPLGRLVTVTDALSGTTVYEYDALGNRTAVIDANGHATAFVYDALGRLITRADPLARTRVYTHSAAGLVIERRDGNGTVLSFQYDPLGRLTRREGPGELTTMDYDALGRLTAVTDTTGVQLYTYDAAGRLQSASLPATGVAIEHAYDPVGAPTALTVTRGLDTLYTFTVRYDDRGWPSCITYTSGATTTAEYDPGGRMIMLRFPNGVTETYHYDEADNVLRVTAAADGDVLAQYRYDYNELGLRTAMTETVDGAFSVHAYGYDDLYRLEEWDRDGATVTYAYDAVGNRKRLTETAGITSYAYDDADQLFLMVGPSGTVAFAYDGNGSLVQRQAGAVSTFYGWDSLNRLVGITDSAGLDLAFSYDYVGRRVQREAGPGEATHYLFDGWSALLEGEDAVLTQGVVANLFGMGGLLGQVGPEGASYAHHDALGNVGLWTDAGGEVAAAFRYEPFGTREALGAGEEPDVGFIGRHGVREEGDAGLVLMGHRYYDPLLGRFISRDPESGQVMAPRTQHPYVYVGNDPVNKIDPLGLNFWDWLLKQAKKGLDLIRDAWAKRGAFLDRVFSLHPGYFLGKAVARELYAMNGLPPEMVDWELQQRFAAASEALVQVTLPIVVPMFNPLLGVLWDGYEVFTGQDLLTGRKLEWWEVVSAASGFFFGAKDLVDDILRGGSRADDVRFRGVGDLDRPGAPKGNRLDDADVSRPGFKQRADLDLPGAPKGNRLDDADLYKPTTKSVDDLDDWPELGKLGDPKVGGVDGGHRGVYNGGGADSPGRGKGAIPPERAIVPYDPEEAAIQAFAHGQLPWHLRVTGRTAEDYGKYGMLTPKEFEAFEEARREFPFVHVLGPEGPGQFSMKVPNDVTGTGSNFATPAELYRRYLMTQGKIPVPDGGEWRVAADLAKGEGGPSFGDIELHTRYKYYVPNVHPSEAWRPFKETEEFLEYVLERAPSLRDLEIDWAYLRYYQMAPPGGIRFTETGSERIPAPWSP